MNLQFLTLHSVLVLDKKAVGLRVISSDGQYYDVELNFLSDKSLLKGLKVEKLIPHGDLLVTKEELDKGIIVKDMSNDKQFCDTVFNLIMSRKEPPTFKEDAKTQVKNETPSTQEKPASKAPKKKGNMKRFLVTVESKEYNPLTKQWEKRHFTGEFEAENALKVRAKAKEFYAVQLDTTKDEIKVIETQLLS